jgi:hypothetical protein
MTILFAGAFVVAIAAGYWAYQRLQSSPSSTAAPAVPALETPALPSGRAVTNPIAQQLEITGLRLTEEKQKAFVRFVVINHSAAEIGDLSANVNLIAVTGKEEKEPVGTFAFKLPSLGPYESRDMTASLSTRLRVYELPDWQFLRASLEVTSPQPVR